MVYRALFTKCCFCSPTLLLDGHSTHYQPQVVRFAMEHNCIILCLPPHTTHESQPLDVGVFAPLKVHWSKVYHDFYWKHPGKIVTKFNFNALFAEAWYGGVTTANIMAGYRRAGVYPLNPQAVTIAADSYDHSVLADSFADQSITRCSDSSGETDEPLATSSGSPDGGDSMTAGPFFMEEQRCCFQTRFEEGFDVAGDQDYTQWLCLNHPDCALLKAGKNQVEVPDSEVTNHSILPHFSSVSSLPEISTDSSPPVSKAPVLQSGQRAPSTSLSTYLTPPAVTPTSRRVEPPRARLLTSATAMELLLERERKKQEEIELKEKKKIEREEAKRKREEEQKRKSEERAKKAEQKAREKAQKEEERARKIEVKKSMAAKSAETKRKHDRDKSEQSARQTKRSRTDTHYASEFNESECCVCYVIYEEDQSGKDLVACACG